MPGTIHTLAVSPRLSSAMEEKIKTTARRRAVQLLSKDLQYFPINRNIDSIIPRYNITERNNKYNGTTMFYQKLTALEEQYKCKLQSVKNKIEAVARTTAYDVVRCCTPLYAVVRSSDGRGTIVGRSLDGHGTDVRLRNSKFIIDVQR